MRKFIVSDLHGNGDVYDSIMSYLENLDEELELYINGDLIDRGLDSYRMLLDVKERIKNPSKIKIKYLGGNHELMMFSALSHKLKRGSYKRFDGWLSARNGGKLIANKLEQESQETLEEMVEFIKDLDIYQIFPETINNSPIILVHAQPPIKVNDICHLKIGDNNIIVQNSVWNRFEDNPLSFAFHFIDKKDFLTIIGHTPLPEIGIEKVRFFNAINIDGGCSGYANGFFNYDHVPLVEIEDNRLSIIIFNHNNEIINGLYYDGDFTNMSFEELTNKRRHINHKYDNQAVIYQKKINLVHNKR